MNDDREATIGALKKQFQALPKDCQETFAWLIKNMDTVEIVCERLSFSAEERRALTKDAVEQGNSLLLLFLFMSQYLEAQKDAESRPL